MNRQMNNLTIATSVGPAYRHLISFAKYTGINSTGIERVKMYISPVLLTESY